MKDRKNNLWKEQVLITTTYTEIREPNKAVETYIWFNEIPSLIVGSIRKEFRTQVDLCTIM